MRSQSLCLLVGAAVDTEGRDQTSLEFELHSRCEVRLLSDNTPLQTCCGPSLPMLTCSDHQTKSTADVRLTPHMPTEWVPGSQASGAAAPLRLIDEQQVGVAKSHWMVLVNAWRKWVQLSNSGPDHRSVKNGPTIFSAVAVTFFKMWHSLLIISRFSVRHIGQHQHTDLLNPNNPTTAM